MMKFNNCIHSILFFSSLLLCSTLSFSANLPIKIDAQGDKFSVGKVTFSVWCYTITSLDDNITLQSLVLNRDNYLISTNDLERNMNAKRNLVSPTHLLAQVTHPTPNVNPLN
ncbi:Uncharacterised protein [Providencia rettgeri]|nr:Uncharacterised protein [Providencia rettgeri]